MKVVLVVGIGGEDSGKTVLAASLISAIRAEGIKSAGFKPYAASVLWGAQLIYRETISRRVLVGSDAMTLWRAMGEELSLEYVNPGSLVLGALDPEKLNWKMGSLSVFETMSRLGVLGRVSTCVGSRVETLHFINVDALKRLPSGLEDAFTDMAVSLKPYPLKVNDEFVSRFVQGEFDENVLSCYSRMSMNYDVVVVESNHNVALPVRKGIVPDLVIGVSPGKAGVIDGERYMKALYLLGSVGVNVDASEAVSLAGVKIAVDLPYLEEPISGYPIEVVSPLVDKLKELLKQ